MAKYNSNRQQNLKIGISSYTEDKTVLEVTGKVGIGTTNAQYSLDVVGDINFTGTFYEDGNQFVASRWSSGDGTEIYRLSNVGIGTTNPTEDLDIAGDVRIRGGLYDVNNQSGTSGQLLVSTVNGVDWQDATEITVIQNILNTTLTGIGISEEGTGIGTDFTSFNFIGPGVTASANGTSVNVTVADYVSNAGVSTSVIGGIGSITQLQVTGISTLGVTSATNLTSQSLVVSGISTLGVTSATNLTSQSLVVGGISTLGITSATNLTSQSLVVSGISTFTNGPVLIGSGTSTGTALQRLQVDGGAYVSSNLGIGTTNPQYKLDVVGDINFTGTFRQNGDQFVASRWTSGSGDNIYRLSNVGIGTTNPTSKLHVIGDANITGVLTALNGIQGIGIQSGGVNITTGIITALNFVGTGISSITNNSGLVSIDIKTPYFYKILESFTATDGQTTFNVNYTPNFVDVYLNGSRLSPNEVTASNGTSIVLTDPAFVDDIVDVVVFANNGQFDSSKWVSTDTVNLFAGSVYRLNGNLGIGTTNPTSKLHVVGNSLITGISTLGITTVTNLTAQSLVVSGVSTFQNNIIQTSGLVGIGTTNPLQKFQIGVANTLGVSTDGKVFVVTEDAKVGIGTTNPLAKLDVRGDANIIGTLDLGHATDTTIARSDAGVVTIEGVEVVTLSRSQTLTNKTLTSPTLITPALGTPSSGTLSSCTGLPVSTGISGLGAGVAAFLGNPTPANLKTAVTDDTGSGALVFSNTPTLVTPAIGSATATSIVVDSVVTINSSGISASSGSISAPQFSTGSGNLGFTTNTISGPSEIIIDPAAVGDDTGAVRIKGDLYVDGTQFIVNSTTIELADFNVGIATTVGTNELLDGAGISIGSTSIRKTLTWNNSSTALKSSEDFDVASGKVYKINGTSVLSNNTLGSGILTSSLTSVGTLGKLQVTGVSTFQNNIIQTSGLVGIGTTNPLQKFQIGVANTLGINSEGTVFVVTSNADVGIGTTNPTSKLHVVGNSLITGISTLGITTVTNLTAQSLVVSGVSTFQNNIIQTSGLVGIGTTNPLQKFQIGVANTLGINSEGTVFVVTSNADVGIGTTNPTAKLDVRGDARVTGVITATTFVGALTGTATSTTNIPNLTGDITSNNLSTTLATVNSNTGTFGSSTAIPNITVNAKGLVTAIGTSSITVGDGTLTLGVSGTGISGSASFTANQTGVSTFTVTSNATSANTASAIVARDASGNFSAGSITATTFVGALTGTASNVTTNANLTGDITSTGNATAIAAGVIVDADINASAGIVDTKLATIATAGKVSNTATTATSANTASAIVSRDASGNFSAGNITANQFSTGASGTGVNISTDTISGPATLTIDPAAVGDNTGAVRIKGDLYVDGTQFIVNSTTIELADFNVGIATTVGTNELLDGAGISIGSTSIRKTLTWNNSSTALKSSEDFDVASGKVYKINGTSVLSNNTLGSGILTSSLTSVGTLGSLSVGNVNSTGIITATTFVGALTGTASNVTTNANLTGDVTSIGNETAIAAGVIVDADINASAAIAVSKLAASTISGVTLGNNLNALTISTGLSGSSYNGSGAVTIAIDSTVATLTGIQTFTNKTLTSPTLTTPVLGTPSSGTLTSCTGLPISGLTASTSTALGVGSIELGHASDTSLTRVSAGVVAIEGVNIVTTSSTDTLTNKTLTSPTLTTPVLGTPQSGTLTSCTGLPVSTGISGLGANVATFLATPSSANLASALTDETGSGSAVFATNPTFSTSVGIGTIIDIIPYDNLNSGTLSFEASAGQLFSITNNLTSGSIFSVNDVSGIPSIDVNANGTILLGTYGGNIGIGTTNATQKLHVVGNASISGTLDLGHASDTTLARVSAGVVSIEGVNIVTTSSTDTLTNKTLTSPILTTPILGTPTSGDLANCTFPTLNQNTTGNAATATKLATAVNIGGVSFDGSVAIDLPGVNAAGNQNTTGTAVGLSATLAVASGGTGVTTKTGTGSVVLSDSPTLVTPVLGAATATSIVVGSGVTINASGIIASAGIITATAFSGALTGNVTGNVSGSSGSCSGNAATATKLATAVNIGGVSFDGSVAIDLPGVNAAGNQNTTGSSASCSGNAATATKLATAVNIGGVSFDGSVAINLPGVNAAGNQNTTGSSASCSGNAATATKLATAVNIGGVSFDGSVAINLPGVNAAGNQNTTGTAAGLSATLAVASGGTGVTTKTGTGSVVLSDSPTFSTSVGIGTIIDIIPYDTLNSGTLSFEASAGQLFSITNNLTSGSIFSVNDVSGIPSIDVNANGTILLGTYGGNIGIGTTNATQKLHVVGNASISGTLDLGHASDTTLARVSAGVVSIEGVNIVTTSSTDTLTNKTLTSPILTTPILGTPTSGDLANCTFPTLNQNTTGSAATATNLSTNRTNWSTNGTISAVVGQLSWKNYGNSHTIFDASASTSPEGGAVNHTNSQVAWTGTYPTLMGWNGTNTYGVRVDSARISDSTSGSSASVVNTVAGTGSIELVRGNMADNDQFRILVGGTSSNQGFVEIATADDGTEPIYVRQYSGAFATITRTATLLDGSGNTTFPGNVTAVNYYGNGANLTGISAGLSVSDDTSTNATRYILFNDATSGTISAINVSSSKLTFNPSSGTLSATIFTSTSDERVKTNIRPITNALDITKKLKGVKFNWKENNLPSLGLIAQEVEKVLPEVVNTDSEDMKSINYSSLVSLLVEAIKELNQKVENLTNNQT